MPKVHKSPVFPTQGRSGRGVTHNPNSSGIPTIVPLFADYEYEGTKLALDHHVGECERVYVVVAVEPPRRDRACQGGVMNAPKARGNTYLRPPLNSSSKTSRHDGSAEKLGLLPETRGLFFLLYEKLLFRSSEFSVISAHGFMLVPGQSSAEYQQLESILEITSPSKFQNILF